MTDVRDPASLVEAAQKAAGEGDYAEAERLLRDAATQQEATLGPDHSDLATTLNNLAFVCERLQKYDEAERGYRRAHAIAVASLSPGHPFIKTSLTNLLDFCAARGIPVWTPPVVPADEEAPDADAVRESLEADFEPEAEPEPEPLVETTASRFPARSLMVAAAVVIVVFVAFIATRPGQGTSPSPGASPAPSSGASPAPSPGPSPAPTSPPPRAEPTVVSTPPAVAPDARPVSKAPVTVLKAQLCTALEKRGSPDWQCRAADANSKPGTYFFYTRVLTTQATVVEHRWYLNGRVHQAMRLRVTPTAGSGYRTFSSNTVSPERAGEWRVELRAADGTSLHEEQFVVR